MAYGNAWSLGFACCITALLVMPHDANAADPSDYLGTTGRHRLLTGDMPPGYVGQARLAGRGFVNGYFQPVALTGPQGTRFSLTRDGGYSEGSELLQAGLLVGTVYRFQITRIPMMEGAELYPTIEVIDRTYPPPGLATRYPIVIHLDQEDLESALAGKMVTRVIYLEDPETAVPMQQTPVTNRPVDIAEYQDALEVADRLGRPVAIVRVGSLAPPRTPALMPGFFFGFPPWSPMKSVGRNAEPSSPPTAVSGPANVQQPQFPAPALDVGPTVTVTDQPLFK